MVSSRSLGTPVVPTSRSVCSHHKRPTLHIPRPLNLLREFLESIFTRLTCLIVHHLLLSVRGLQTIHIMLWIPPPCHKSSPSIDIHIKLLPVLVECAYHGFLYHKTNARLWYLEALEYVHSIRAFLRPHRDGKLDNNLSLFEDIGTAEEPYQVVSRGWFYPPRV
jgi:hypothetical protein